MDEEHCVIAVISSNLRDSNTPQIKRRYNVFPICPAIPIERRCKITNFFSFGQKKFLFNPPRRFAPPLRRRGEKNVQWQLLPSLEGCLKGRVGN